MLTAAMSIFMGVKDPSEVAVVAKQAGEVSQFYHLFLLPSFRPFIALLTQKARNRIFHSHYDVNESHRHRLLVIASRSVVKIARIPVVDPPITPRRPCRQLINLVVTLLDALKTSFSQRALEARSLGMPYSDAAIAGISLLKVTFSLP